MANEKKITAAGDILGVNLPETPTPDVPDTTPKTPSQPQPKAPGGSSYFRGAWDAEKSYGAGEIVSYSGEYYLASADIPSGQDPPEQNTAWVVITDERGLNQGEVDARVSAGIDSDVQPWAQTENEDALPASKIPNIPADKLPNIPSDKLPPPQPQGLDTAAVDARIDRRVADEAKEGNAERWPDDKLPTDLAKQSDIPTNSDIDDRIAVQARRGNNTRWGKNKLPNDTAYEEDIRTDAEIDARIDRKVASEAEQGNTERWGKDKLPTDTAYDADIPSNADIDARVKSGVADEAEQGNTERWSKDKLPTDTAYEDDIRTDAEIDARIAPEAQARNTDRWPKNKLPADTRYDDVDNADIDSRIAPEARAGNTDRWDEDKLPTDLAKTSDIRSDADIQAEARKVVADEAQEGNNDRWDADKLPANVAYKTADKDVRSVNEIDARIEEEARANNTDRWPIEKLPANVATDSDIRTDAEIDARVRAGVADEAQEGNTERWGKDKLPPDTAYDADVPTNSDIDDRIAVQARRGNNTRWGKNKLPLDAVYDADLRTDAEVEELADARIAAEARAGNNDRWGKEKLPTDTKYLNTYRGDWDASASYSTGDIVFFLNRFYIAHQNISPTSTNPDASDSWELLNQDAHTTGARLGFSPFTISDARTTTGFWDTLRTMRIGDGLGVIILRWAANPPSTGRFSVSVRIRERNADNTGAYRTLETTAPSSYTINNEMVDREQVYLTGEFTKIIQTRVDKRYYIDIRCRGASDGEQFFFPGNLQNLVYMSVAPGFSNADIDARIADEAQEGNTERWDKDKLPTDVVYQKTYRGTWAAGTYAVGDIVAYQSKFYIAKTARTASNTDHPSTDAEWVDITQEGGTGGGGGLTQAQADARIRALVDDTAEEGNTDRWEKDKLPTDTAYGTIRTDSEINTLADARVQAGVENWAQEGNTDDIPDSKLSDNAITTTTEIDARIADEAKEGNTERWPADKLPTDVAYDADLRTDAQVNTLADARVVAGTRAEARASNTTRWPKNKLPTDVVYQKTYRGTWSAGTYAVGDIVAYQSKFYIAKTARTASNTDNPGDDAEWVDITQEGGTGGGGLTQAQVDARVVAGTRAEARASNTTRWPKNKLPSDTAYDADIRTDAEIDERIATEARASNTDRWPESKLPTDIVYSKTYQGTWAVGDYGIGDIVQYGGNFYIASAARKVANTDNPSQDTTWLAVAGPATGVGSIYRFRDITVLTPTIRFATNNTLTGYSSLMGTQTVNESGLISFDMDLGIVHQQGNAWCGVQFRLQRSRSGDLTTLDTTPLSVYNANAVTTSGDHQFHRRFFIEDHQPGDAYVIQVAGQSSNVTNSGNFTIHSDSIIELETFSPAAASNVEIDSRIATFARVGATVNIPDARLPAVLRGLPSAIGTAGQVLQVNSDADALEFADAASGGGGASLAQLITSSSGVQLPGQVSTGWGAWTNIFSFSSIAAGTHLCTISVQGSYEGTSTSANVVVQFQLVRGTTILQTFAPASGQPGDYLAGNLMRLRSMTRVGRRYFDSRYFNVTLTGTTTAQGSIAIQGRCLTTSPVSGRNYIRMSGLGSLITWA